MRWGQRKNQARIDRSVGKPPSDKDLKIKKGAIIAGSILAASGTIALSSLAFRSANISRAQNYWKSVGAVI